MGIRRFLTGFFEEQSSDPGLEIEDDGKLYLVLPGGTRREITGGAGLPEQWTVGEGGRLRILQSAEDGTTLLVESAYEASDVAEVFAITDSNFDGIFAVASDGSVTVRDLTGGSALAIVATVAKTNNYLVAVSDGGITTVFRVDKSGNPVLIGNHAAPANADLEAGECALWFDQTNGAAKLMIKGKSANGTVVTGSVNLA